MDLQKYIGQITGQLQPTLDAFLKALGIRTERKQTKTLHRAQAEGRVTTGFLPEMRREVREEAGMQEAQFRGTHAQSIMQLAMQLFGMEKEYGQFQEEMKWKTEQSELDRALQRELAKTSGGGDGDISFDFGGGTGKIADSFKGFVGTPVKKQAFGLGTLSGKTTKQSLEKFTPKTTTTAYRGGGLRGSAIPTRTTAYRPSQKATTYRGTRLGRI